NRWRTSMGSTPHSTRSSKRRLPAKAHALSPPQHSRNSSPSCSWRSSVTRMRNFSVLSDVEFEELAADVLAAELATSVERFAAGPDGGIDLRLKRGTGIAQCKHYARSSFAQLLRAARKELKHVEDLAPTEYRFITSFDLSTTQKKQIYTVFERWMRAEESVVGGRDLEG